jgi:endonuclease/exonuclease/phosphatase family metal-dependent hydrolase
LSVFRDVFQAHQKHLRYRPVPERPAAIVGQLDSFLLNAFGTVSVTVEVSRPGLYVLLPWNLANFFWWANPTQPQRWADNDVEASTHALGALLERTGGTPCAPSAPQLGRLQASGFGDRAKEDATRPAAAVPPTPARRWVSALAMLWLTTAVGCSNPNYALEACPMKPTTTVAERNGRPASDLRVMTLNMWGIRFVAADIDARFDALAERLNADTGIHVVGLQEVWADAPRRRLMESVAQAFPYQVDFQGEHGRSGLAILSRHPFVGAPRFIPYPQAGKWWKPWTGEWFGGKGVGAVEIQSPAGLIWFFVTHLHACYAPGAPGTCDDGDEYGYYRGHQLETLRATVNEIAGDRLALIAGDFNFTAQSKYYKAIISTGVHPSEAYDPGWQRVEEPEAPPARIDYVWIRPGKNETWQTAEAARTMFTEPVRSGNGAGVPLSDHCAVVATLRSGSLPD